MNKTNFDEDFKGIIPSEGMKKCSEASRKQFGTTHSTAQSIDSITSVETGESLKKQKWKIIQRDDL